MMSAGAGAARATGSSTTDRKFCSTDSGGAYSRSRSAAANGWASRPASRSRFIRTCCAMPAAINSPTMAATPAQSSIISDTETSSTRSPTPRWRRIVSPRGALRNIRAVAIENRQRVHIGLSFSLSAASGQEFLQTATVVREPRANDADCGNLSFRPPSSGRCHIAVV